MSQVQFLHRPPPIRFPYVFHIEQTAPKPFTLPELTKIRASRINLARFRAFAYHAGKSAARMRMARPRSSSGRLDDAARAGWLYYIAGKTQDEIAAAHGHLAPGGAAAGVARGLRAAGAGLDGAPDRPLPRPRRRASSERFGLVRAEVVPSDPDDDGGTVGLGEAGAAEMARWLRRERPIVMAVGTGRTLKAAIDHLPPISCPQHRVVSLTGNIGPDGSAAYYNVIFSMAEAVEARHFPMPLPVFVASPEERALMHGQSADPLDAGARGRRRRRLRRHRRDGRRGAALRRPLPDRATNSPPSRPPAPSARSAAGSSTARAGCSPAAPTPAPPARRFPTATAPR